MVIDIHHEGTIESHPYRVRELIGSRWVICRNFAYQPRKFRTMQEAMDWAKDYQDRGIPLDYPSSQPTLHGFGL